MMENNMETTISELSIYRGYNVIMENRMETTIL